MEINERGVSMESICIKAGLGKDTIGNWSRGYRVPNIGNVRAALGVLGLTLIAVRKKAR